jgi:hypothetical protein
VRSTGKFFVEEHIAAFDEDPMELDWHSNRKMARNSIRPYRSDVEETLRAGQRSAL